MEVNLEKLAAGNKLGKSIAKRLGYKKTKYWQFLQDHCFTNVHPDVMPHLDEILYAKTVTEHYCNQYYGLIFKETRRLRHLLPEERLSIGHEAIWKALHNYTDAKTSMTQWLMFGLRMYSHKNIVKETKDRLIIEKVAEFLPDAKQPNPVLQLIDSDENSILDYWERKAGIRGENKIILHFYLTKAAYKGWINDYLADFNARTGEKRHPKYIVMKMAEIKRRLANFLKSEGVEIPIAI